MAHILIVDDSATDAKLFSAMLERAGHKVSHAADAESGIARAKSEIPDLILMDVIMGVCRTVRVAHGPAGGARIVDTSETDGDHPPDRGGPSSSGSWPPVRA